MALDKVTTGLIADNAIDSDQYVDGSIDSAHVGNLQVTAAKVAADVATQSELDTVSTSVTTTETNQKVIEKNVAMLGFFRASDDAKAQYSLVDQVIDQFQDATGIDAANSTAEVHDNTTKFYCATTGVVGPTHFAGTGSKQTFTVPTGVSSITIHAYGAQHNNYGGYSVGTLAVSAGTGYSIVVGTVETASPGSSSTGYGGGGHATNAV